MFNGKNGTVTGQQPRLSHDFSEPSAHLRKGFSDFSKGAVLDSFHQFFKDIVVFECNVLEPSKILLHFVFMASPKISDANNLSLPVFFIRANNLGDFGIFVGVIIRKLIGVVSNNLTPRISLMSITFVFLRALCDLPSLVTPAVFLPVPLSLDDERHTNLRAGSG